MIILQYPFGVALNNQVVGSSLAEVRRKVYLDNRELDTDLDGLICENERLQSNTQVQKGAVTSTTLSAVTSTTLSAVTSTTLSAVTSTTLSAVTSTTLSVVTSTTSMSRVTPLPKNIAYWLGGVTDSGSGGFIWTLNISWDPPSDSTTSHRIALPNSEIMIVPAGTNSVSRQIEMQRYPQSGDTMQLSATAEGLRESYRVRKLLQGTTSSTTPTTIRVRSSNSSTTTAVSSPTTAISPTPTTVPQTTTVPQRTTTTTSCVPDAYELGRLASAIRPWHLNYKRTRAYFIYMGEVDKARVLDVAYEVAQRDHDKAREALLRCERVYWQLPDFDRYSR
jgi:hypothetical protein